MEPPPYSSCVREQSIFTIEPLPPPSDLPNYQVPPPSYESIFGRIKSAHAQSNSNFELCRKVVEILSQTVGCLIIVGVFAAFPIAQIVMGVRHFNDCPLNGKVPLFLVVFGGSVLLRFIVAMMSSVNRANKKRKENRDRENTENDSSSKRPNFFAHILNMFIFIWFIMGNIWVFDALNALSSDIKSAYYCNSQVYYFAFWSIIGIYILIGATCLFIVCVGAIAMCFSGTTGSHTGNAEMDRT